MASSPLAFGMMNGGASSPDDSGDVAKRIKLESASSTSQLGS